MPTIAVIIVAGGSGARMGAVVPKQFLPLAGKPILVHTLERFIEALPDAKITIALPASETDRWTVIAESYGLGNTHSVCAGGATRFESVKNALAAIGHSDLIAIHDGVRPLVSSQLIHRACTAAEIYGAVVPAIEPEDSFRCITPDGSSSPLDRSVLRAVQTPQVFRAELLMAAYQNEYDPRFTDDASVVQQAGFPVTLCEGDPMNIKITTPMHLLLARTIIESSNG